MLAPSCVSSSRSRAGGAGGRGLGSLSSRRSLTCCLLSGTWCRQQRGRSGLRGCRFCPHPPPLPRQIPVPAAGRVHMPHPTERKEAPGAMKSIRHRDKPFPPTISGRSNRQARSDGESRGLLKCLFFRDCSPSSHTSPCLCPTAFPKD